MTRKSDRNGRNQCARQVGDEGPGERRLHRVAVAARDREDPEDRREDPGEHDRQPHVRRGREDVADRQDRVVEHAAAGRRWRRPCCPVHQLSRIAGISRASVYGRAAMITSVTGAPESQTLRPRSPWRRRAPEVEVLLPEREVEPEEAACSRRSCRPTASGATWVRDRRLWTGIAGHEARDHPVDRRRDPEREQVDDELAPEVPSHAVSASLGR